jgi:hypothetical protein
MMVSFHRACTIPIRSFEPSCCVAVGVPFMPILETKKRKCGFYSVELRVAFDILDHNDYQLSRKASCKDLQVVLLVRFFVLISYANA